MVTLLLLGSISFIDVEESTKCNKVVDKCSKNLDKCYNVLCFKKVFKISIYDRCSVIGESWNVLDITK